MPTGARGRDVVLWLEDLRRDLGYGVRALIGAVRVEPMVALRHE
jgi:hypothetical protein